jgi:hypothetical protein
MSQPEPFETQNKSDDDGQVIDSFFIETDSPPDLKQLQDPILVKQLVDPKPFTRIISGERTIDPTAGWAPQVLLNSDINRQYLFIRVESLSAVATDGMRVGDDPGMISSAGIVAHGKTIQMDPHTGPLYATPAALTASGVASGKVSISWWAVTF